MIIQAQNISHMYKQDRALENINLTIGEGEFVAIVGKSGSGKSTLLSILSTLLHPTSGELTLLGTKTQDIHNIDAFRRKNIGFIFQFHYLINYLTVYENITLAIYKEYKKDVDALLKKLGIFELKQRYPHEISGGQRQRVAIARALANKPKIVFADEPTGNLDSQNSDNVFKMLQIIAKQQNVTVIVATHDLEQAQSADTIYEMNDGHISNYN